jgi:hypothetical protein
MRGVEFWFAAVERQARVNLPRADKRARHPPFPRRMSGVRYGAGYLSAARAVRGRPAFCRKPLDGHPVKSGGSVTPSGPPLQFWVKVND